MFFPPECDTAAHQSARSNRLGVRRRLLTSDRHITCSQSETEARGLVVGYFTVLSVITAVCAFLAPETNKKDIDLRLPQLTE